MDSLRTKPKSELAVRVWFAGVKPVGLLEDSPQGVPRPACWIAAVSGPLSLACGIHLLRGPFIDDRLGRVLTRFETFLLGLGYASLGIVLLAFVLVNSYLRTREPSSNEPKS